MYVKGLANFCLKRYMQFNYGLGKGLKQKEAGP